MMGRLTLSRRADRFAATLLALATLCIAAAALVPVLPGAGSDGFRSGVGLPVPPGGDALGTYRRASPFDPQHRPVDAGAVLPNDVRPVFEPAPVAEAPATLAGILVRGSSRKVLFAGGGWQGIGSAVGSWTVAAIEPQHVTLRRGAETLLLNARDALLAR